MKFGTKIVKGLVTDAYQLTAVAPPSEHINSNRVVVEVSLDGTAWSSAGLTFDYEADTVVTHG